MGKIERFEDLNCWQEARNLVKLVYLRSSKGELSRDFDMKSQLRRAVVSIMNNIAEGFGRISVREKVRFLEYSTASVNEVRSLTYVAFDLHYWTEEEAHEVLHKAESVKALTLGFIRYLKALKPKSTPEHPNTLTL